MEELFAKLGVDNIDDAIAKLSEAELECKVIESSCSRIAVALPFSFMHPDDVETLPSEPKKSVRFSDDVVEKQFVANRADNVCPKEKLPHAPGEVFAFQCRMGAYLDKETSNPAEVISNSKFNSSSAVNNLKQKSDASVMPRRQVSEHKTKNYMNTTNPVDHVSTSILLDGNGIISLISQEFLFDCIMNMMQMYEHLEEEGSSYTLSYKESVTISNKPGKRQRHIVKNKIEELTKLYL